MKNLKKKMMVLFAVGVMAFSVSPFVLAATPQPAGNAAQESGQVQQQAANIPAAGGVAANIDTSKYLTKGGAACWFVVVAVLNIALSFWIGNRFYRMSKKDNHISAEVRALRRDIEDKFTKNIGGFSEQELDIENLNESLAYDEAGIQPNERPSVSNMTEEEEERFRRWEAAQARAYSDKKQERGAVKSIVREELQEDLDDVKKINRKNYQPKREHQEEIADEDIDATREVKLSEGVKSKAKGFINDMFPFKED